MDAVAAQALYVGIATDTGQFRFSSTTCETFEICCHLMERGADPASAAMELYERESPGQARPLATLPRQFPVPMRKPGLHRNH
jgi:phosphoesterase RecJ-like protein